jgi:ABC-type nitrate/sulfonate/bicarbonate transport system ATPase subunit
MPLKINNLTFSYSQNQNVFQNLSLEIKDGECVALLGFSGSGKSTLFNLISSLVQNYVGTISIQGYENTDISYISQSATDMSFPWKRVISNIQFPLKLRKKLNKETENKISSLIRILRLEHRLNHYPSQLSGGELKRLSIASGLAYSPKLILLDEVFTGLDFALKWELWSFIKQEIKSLKATTIIATHDLDEAVYLSDRIIFINKNKTIDVRQVLIEQTENLNIEQALTSKILVSAREQTLKLYKEINNE